MATMLAATAARAANTHKVRVASMATRAFTSTNVVCANPTVDFEHFSSGWNIDTSELGEKGKFHIKTFNKISPLVSNCLAALS